MGYHRARKSTFAASLAAVAIAFMLAASDGIALEATEIGPGPAGQGVSPGATGKGEGPWAKAGSTLRRVFAAHNAHQQSARDAPFKPDNPSVRFAKGLILIDAVAASDGATLLEDLRGLGLQGGTQYGAVVSGRIPLGLLNRVVGLESLRGVSASLKPETNSAADATFGLVHDRRAAMAMNLVASQADPQTYTGDGIKVGVLSDTFDNNGFPDYDGDGWPDMPATFADDDLANGDLPGGPGPFVGLHTPGDVDDNDKSSYGANGTSGSNTTAGNPGQSANLGASIRFDPASYTEEPITAIVTYPDANQYTIGSKPFTIEMWVRFENAFTGGKASVLASHYTSHVANQRSWFLMPRGPLDSFPDSLLFWASPDGGSANAEALTWPWIPTDNVWYHVAVTRDANNNMRAYINGQEIGSAQPLNISVFDTSEVLRLSSLRTTPGNNGPLDGWMEDFRFVVGEALYTENFTPPGPLASELPPPPTATTTVIDDSGNPGIDEGRAMMQLIHDVAPDASVSFHTAFNGMADFAQGIKDLANDGADVIVDDIIYFAEPMFQDGIIAQAVDNVVAQGKAYFSSAGNGARHSYESPFVASGERLTVGPEERGMLHDFDPGEGVDYMQSVTIPFGTTFTLVAQWDQPFASNCPDPQPPQGCPGSENDVDIYLVDDQLQILTSSISDNLATGEPVEILQLQNASQSFGTDFHIMMTHYDVKTSLHPKPGSPPTLMKYVWFGQSEITVNEHTTDSGTSYGHANAVGAEAVGAAFYLDTPAFGVSPPQRESFSSKGGVPILFDVSGNSLGAPGPREKPEIVAPDGTNTTFFFRDTSLDDADELPEVFPNFFGTSAAAPHAAAIAALMLEANPTLTPGDIYLILENTAVDMAAGGFDFDTGYGLIDATAALAQATGGNLVPLAENDAVSTNQNTLVSIPVLANDALGNQTTNITNVTDPQFGSAVINGTSIDYTPDTDLFGPDSFNYTITDNDGETSVATVNVMVNEIDVQPIAAHDNTSTDEDITVSNIDVMANDDPLGNAPTTITAAGPGKLGSTVTIAPDGGSISYDPAPDDSGIDVFPYTITDADNQSSNANVTVTINPVNDDPVADNDPTSTNEDTPVDFTEAFMLDGDSDVDLDALTVSVVSNSSFLGGNVSPNGVGNYTYTPPPNLSGDDAVSYIVSDSNGGSGTGSVTITIAPINDAPDAASVANQNSQDGDAGISVDASTDDIEGDTLTYSVGGQPAGLSIDINTGEITGTIDGSASTGGPLSDGAYTVTVTASDASLGTDYEFTWTVSAGPVNGSPNAAIVADQNNQDGQAVTPVDASTTDPELDTLTYGVSGQPAGLSIDANTGIISGTLTNSASQGSVYTVTVTADDGISTPTDYQFTWTVTDPAPNAATVANQNGQDGDAITPIDASTSDPDGDTLSYSVSGQPAGLSIDANSGVISGTLASGASQGGSGGFHTVTVTASDGTTPTDYQFSWTVTNPAPVATNDNDNTSEDVAVVIDVRGNDSDLDGDTLSVSAITQGANGAVAITNGGADVTYTPDGGFFGNDSFTYTVSDGNGGSDIGTVNITVNAVNDDPVATVDNDSTSEDVAVVVDVLGNDSDPDGDGLSVSAVTQGANGAVAITNGGADVTYTPNGGFFGNDSFTYTVSDGNGGSDIGTVNITVNALPSTVHLGDISGSSASAPRNRWEATATVVVHDAGHTAIGIGALVEGNWSNGTNGGDSCTTDQFGSCSITKGNLKSGVSSVTFSVTNITFGSDTYDSGANDAGSTVQIGQPGTNNAPVANNDSDTTDENVAVVINVLGNDTDPDGDSLSVSSVTQGSDGGVTNNGTNVTYTPNTGFTGGDSFTYTISDGNGGGDTATVNVTVNASGNAAPTANNDNGVTDEDFDVVIDVLSNDTDPDPNTLTVSSVTNGSNGTVTNNGGDVTYSPNANFNGADSFTYTVSDGNGGNDTATVNVTVNAINDLPAANDDSDTTTENTPVDIDVLANDTDAEGQGLIISTFSQGTSGSVADNAGILTYTPNNGFSGNDSFTYTASDGIGDSNTATVNVTVDAAGTISLSANGYKVKGVQHADLTWGGASGLVDVYRDTVLIGEDISGTFYTDNIGNKGGGSYTYEVCDANSTTNCSNSVNVNF